MVESGVSPVPRQPPHSTTLREIRRTPPGAKCLGVRTAAPLLPLSHSRCSSKTIIAILPPCRRQKLPGLWPHAPTHQLSESATYFLTASTYLKQHHFRGRERLAVLHRGLLTVAHDFDWQLEAWAVFSNHYHFVAKSPRSEPDASSLSQMLGVLHTKTSGWVNRLDQTPGRKVWHNFRETKLTYQRSYLARLNYTHQNAGETWFGAGGQSISVVLGGMV